MSVGSDLNLESITIDSAAAVDRLALHVAFALEVFESISGIAATLQEKIQRDIGNTAWKLLFFSNESHLAELAFEKPLHVLIVSDYWGHDYSKDNTPRRYVDELLGRIMQRRLTVGLSASPFVILERRIRCPDPDRYKRNVHFDTEMTLWETDLRDAIRKTVYTGLIWRGWEESEMSNMANIAVKLGKMHENAEHELRDHDQAIWWYEKAAACGSREAVIRLARLYDTVLRDYSGARRWYQRAADAGDLEARMRLDEISMYFSDKPRK